MRFLITLALATALTVVQAVLFPHGGPLPRPDLLVVYVTLWGVMLGLQQGLLAATLGGLLADSLSAGPFGAGLLALLAAACVAALRERHLVDSRFLLCLLLAPLATAVYYGVDLLILQLAGWSFEWSAQTTELVVPALLANTVGTALLYPALALAAARLGMPYSGTLLRRAG